MKQHKRNLLTWASGGWAMSTGSSARDLGSLFLGAACALALAACGEEAIDTEQADALAQRGDDVILTMDDLWLPKAPESKRTRIQLCFSSDIQADEYSLIREGIQWAADRWAWATDDWLEFGTIKNCGSGIPISLTDNDEFAGKAGRGPDAAGMWFNPEKIEYPYQARRVPLHEIGHILGFAHEQMHPESTCDQPDRGVLSSDPIYWKYDAKSIMNYCFYALNLSPGDIEAVRRLYGGDGMYLDDGHSHWIRTGLGPMLFRSGSSLTTHESPGMDQGGMFIIKNRTKSGEPIRYGDRFTIKNKENGLYLGITATTNAKSTPKIRYQQGYSEERFEWIARGFSRDGNHVNINEPVALSADVDVKYTFGATCHRKAGNTCTNTLYLTAHRVARPDSPVLQLVENNTTTPPKSEDYMFRILGPVF